MRDFSTAPTIVPARSYSPSGYMPGISAVSPPISAQPLRLASPRNPGDHLRRHTGVEFSHREIVEKEKRLRALYRDVVHAVVDQVLADRVVASGGERDLQLGADAIDGTHQHRLAHFRQRETAAERADVGKNAFGKRGARHLADLADRAVGFIDIDAGVLVGNGFCQRISITRT